MYLLLKILGTVVVISRRLRGMGVPTKKFGQYIPVPMAETGERKHFVVLSSGQYVNCQSESENFLKFSLTRFNFKIQEILETSPPGFKLFRDVSFRPAQRYSPPTTSSSVFATSSVFVTSIKSLSRNVVCLFQIQL